MGGLPIVFIPGLLTTGRIYQHQAEHLGQRHPILFANSWSGATMAESARQILDAAPERFALVGTSMGGYVAFEILRQAAGRVARLALLSTSARPDTRERSAGRREQVAAVRQRGIRWGSLALWPNLVHPARHEDLALRRVFIEMAEELGPDAFARQIEAIIGRPDSRPLLPSITVPTLVVAGAEDQLIPPENAREMAEGIAGARLEIVPHCAHMGMIERPESYTKLLSAFLD
ncbi:MAG: alpha/beta fold hydrolase [Alphaproteobacteria bacterium]|nr:alpha/beta fold hydrolase [Alphaproteobacteria bacterium]